MKTIRIAPLALATLSLLPLAGCASHYVHRFAPAPLEVELYPDNQPGATARGLVAVRGIRRPADGRGPVVEMLLRIENVGDAPVEFLAESPSLVSADLRDMGRVEVKPAAEPIEPGVTQVYELGFELPEGQKPNDFDLRGINLKFEVRFGDERVMTGVNFERVFEPVPNGPQWGFGFGYVWR